MSSRSDRDLLVTGMVLCGSFMTCCAFIASASLCHRTFSSWLQSRGGVVRRSPAVHPPCATDPALVQSLERCQYQTLEGADEQCCAICLVDFEHGETVKRLPCNHIFHDEECISKWLEKSTNCPVCNRDLRECSIVSLDNAITQI
jgi:hypothetical protein